MDRKVKEMSGMLWNGMEKVRHVKERKVKESEGK
jgi:hypothetical protein